jgi:hypothetical protein
MVRYQKVLWKHDFDDEPVMLYSEITEEGIETRKVDEFRDGRFAFADRKRSTGSTFLSEKKMPTIKEIAQQAEFQPQEITKDEFELVWRKATGKG